MGGNVTVIAFSDGRYVELRFSDGQYVVVAFAAISENFEMINKWDNGISDGCMTGLTGITAGEVIQRFSRNFTRARNKINFAVMTNHAI